MEIRTATDADWPGIWTILSWVVSTGEHFTWGPDTTEEWARAKWTAGATIVAVDPDGTVVGTAYTAPNQPGHGAHVANAGFAVSPGHGGRGIGRALGERVLADAKAAGYHAMQFNAVVATNAPAVRLWTSLGFDILATVPSAFRHPAEGYVGLHIMHRTL
ncbi:GNAT family N-acetyltransferase [Catenuloplanes sp. NPDC051500]|uniref:GNAT family N-acetyltransferase n=1 Tax=Catenuloplanes sp. NPDC051500 TaxID=3363959 RepID=UPI0037AB8D5B